MSRECQTHVICSRVSNAVVPAPPSVALRAPPSLACPAATKEPSVTGLLSLGGFVFFSGITGFLTAVVYGFYFFLSYGPYRSVFSVYLSRPMPRVHPRTMVTYMFLEVASVVSYGVHVAVTSIPFVACWQGGCCDTV